MFITRSFNNFGMYVLINRTNFIVGNKFHNLRCVKKTLSCTVKSAACVFLQKLISQIYWHLPVHPCYKFAIFDSKLRKNYQYFPKIAYEIVIKCYNNHLKMQKFDKFVEKWAPFLIFTNFPTI